MTIKSGAVLDLAGFNETIGSLADNAGSGGTMTSSASGTSTLITGGNNTSTSFAGLIQNGSGTIALTKIGTGTWTLGGSNTFTGQVAIQNGMLSVNAVGTTTTAQPLGENTAGTITLGVAATSSGILQYTGTGGTLDKNIAAIGNGTIQNAGSGLLNLTGTLTKNGTTLTITASSGAGITVSGPIVGARANSDLIVTGGTVTLSGTNTYNGNTFVNTSGYLLDGINNGLPTGTTLTLGSSTPSVGTFDLGGFNQQVAGLATAGTASSQTITNNGANNGTLTFSGGTSTFGGVIQNGSKAISMVVSAGTLTFSGTNTYSGSTTINTGKLLLSGTGAINSTSGITINGSGGFSTLCKPVPPLPPQR